MQDACHIPWNASYVARGTGLVRVRCPPRIHHSEKTAHGHLSGQALTFGAFARFDPEKRGWLGPGLKTLKPRSFFRAVKAGARLSLLRGAAGGDFLGASILLQLQRAAPRLSPPVRCHSHSPVVGLLLHRRAAHKMLVAKGELTKFAIFDQQRVRDK